MLHALLAQCWAHGKAQRTGSWCYYFYEKTKSQESGPRQAGRVSINAHLENHRNNLTLARYLKNAVGSISRASAHRVRTACASVKKCVVMVTQRASPIFQPGRPDARHRSQRCPFTSRPSGPCFFPGLGRARGTAFLCLRLSLSLSQSSSFSANSIFLCSEPQSILNLAVKDS